jgi:predicted PurR-regulated permease PerM
MVMKAKVLAAGVSDAAVRNAIVVLAVLGAGAALIWLRPILTPLLMALFLMVLIDGLARTLEHRIPRFPRAAALPVALIISLGLFAMTVVFIVDNGGSFVSQLTQSGPRLQTVVERIARGAGLNPARASQLISQLDPSRYLGPVASAIQNVVMSALFVLVYLAFLLASRNGFGRKVVTLFPSHEERHQAAAAFSRIRLGIERYVWVQTVVGGLIALAAWALMAAVGLENALFWAFFIFVTAYIPLIGAAAGIIAPGLFALVQFDTFWQPLTVLGGLEAIFFVIGNGLLPRMQGKSLNLDPVVILLSLAFWEIHRNISAARMIDTPPMAAAITWLEMTARMDAADKAPAIHGRTLRLISWG